MKISGKVTLSPDPQEQQILFEALKTDTRSTDRSHISYEQKKETIAVSIDAEDATAFRASMNALCQILVLYERTRSL